MSMILVLATLLGAVLSAEVSQKLPLIAIGRLNAIKVDSSETEVIAESMSSALIATRRVRVMERVQVDRVLAEQGFQQSGVCEVSNCAVKAGKLLGVDRIVVGSVGRVGKSSTLNLRTVDIASGEVVGSSTRTVQGDLEELIRILPEAARDLVASEPAVAPPPAAAAKPSKGPGGGYFGLSYSSPGPPGVQAIRVLQGLTDTGVAITVVAKASPAEAAGLKVGDIILEKDGTPVLGIDHFKFQLSVVAPGETVLLKVRRDSRILEIRVQASTRP